MKREKIYPWCKASLVGKINGLAGQAKQTKRRMKECTDDIPKYASFQQTKRYLRYEARYHQLAYAFLRGVPYKVVEKTCTYAPIPEVIMKVLGIFGLWYVNPSYIDRGLKMIREWLETPIEPKKESHAIEP